MCILFDVIVVCGPTASGKSDLALKIAKFCDGEIVSADSMQIYKEMNIGTAKPSSSDRLQIKHHLVDFISVEDEYNVSQFVADASTVIEDILSRGKVPIIAGGTGLYIDSLINNVDFQNTESSDEIRSKLKKMYDDYGLEYLHNKLSLIDPVAAENIHKNNVKRVMRALEINLSTGMNLAEVNSKSLRDRKYSPLFIGVNYSDRDVLYNRINVRVDKMITSGLLEEVKQIANMNLSATAAGAIGYKELFDFLNGSISFEAAVETLKQKTRNYAKRQLTWFKRNKEINWFYPDKYKTREEFEDDVLEFLKKRRGVN